MRKLFVAISIFYSSLIWAQKPFRVNLNSKVEDDKLKKDFINSIETYGILEPIVVNENFEIISGHRRFFACLELCISSVPVRIKSFENEILAIIHFNN